MKMMILLKSKKKRSKLNINYDHLKKEEKQIENPL